MAILTDVFTVTVAMVAREEETPPRVARPLIVSLVAERLQLQTLGLGAFARRALWQMRRLFSAEGYARS
jgi:hypothetical protein